MAVVFLGNTSLGESTVHRGMNSADPLQRHGDLFFLTESSHPLSERYPLERETLSGETQDDTIPILCDAIMALCCLPATQTKIIVKIRT